MTLLIDPPNSPGHGRLWSHLASDSSYDELHRFAAALGIPRRGFDRDHYDIPAERHAAVVAAGAVPVSGRELVERLTAAGLRRRKADTLAPRRPGRPLLRAPRLRPGDTVAVVAPAGPVAAERLEAGLDVLRSWRLEVRVLPTVRGPAATLPYLAGDDAARAADLVEAWTDPAVRAVLCARGGYGVQRMVDLLDWDALAAAGPKVLVGFSDVTALHQAFGARLGLSTVHGPNVSGLGDPRPDAETSREHLRRLLLEPAPQVLTAEPPVALVPGRAEGVLVGGNLAVLCADVGGPTSLPAFGAVALLEEVGEPLYRVDRLLTQLLRSGWLDGVRGIALGDFTDSASAASLQALARDRLEPLDVPVLWGLPVGHEPRNLAVPLGVPAVLDADAGTLTVRDRPLR